MNVIRLFEDTPACCGNCNQGDLTCPTPEACLLHASEPSRWIEAGKDLCLAAVVLLAIVGGLWAISK